MSVPLLIHSITPEILESYRLRIRKELPEYFTNNPEYEIVYKLKDDQPADYVRAIQEPEILKTRLKLKDHKTGQLKPLPSFHDLWNDPSSGLSTEVLQSDDPQEAKWSLSLKYGYKIATTFMPMYAKAIYEYFGVKSVLDPCSGWGDRMCGALSSHCVRRYVGFDPNKNLVPGYKKIQSDFGHEVRVESPDHVGFDNEYEIYSVAFEKGDLGDEKFDFAFTSPPFFDYEDYSDENPKYRNWFKEFYEPLFKLTEMHLTQNAFFAVHIDDTSAGKIRDFLFRTVCQITSFRFRGKIGLIGGKSGKIRNVYLFQKTK